MSKTKPRYCMVVHAYYPIGEPRVEREAETLAAHGYDVDVICLRNSSEVKMEKIGGINIYRQAVRRHKKSGVVVQFFEYLAFFALAFFYLTRRAAQYDVVHVHNPPDFLVFATLIPRLRGAKIVLDIHDLMPEFFLSRFKGGAGKGLVWLLELQEQLACRFAHNVITVSEPWRQTLIQRGVPDEKTVVVMNVAGTRFSRGAAQVQPISTSESDFHLFYHGNLSHRYGIDLALQAVAQVRDKLPGLRFTIHGRGDYLDDLLRISHELGLDDRVTFSTDYVPTETLPGLIAAAHVGLVPYRHDVFTDGILPTKLMEYVAIGIPAIVARTATIEAYFDETMVQFFTSENVDELADRLTELYHNRDKLTQLARNSETFNEQYNWSKQTNNLLGMADRLTRQAGI